MKLEDSQHMLSVLTIKNHQHDIESSHYWCIEWNNIKLVKECV